MWKILKFSREFIKICIFSSNGQVGKVCSGGTMLLSYLHRLLGKVQGGRTGIIPGMVWYGIVLYGMVWYGMV